MDDLNADSGAMLGLLGGAVLGVVIAIGGGFLYAATADVGPLGNLLLWLMGFLGGAALSQLPRHPFAIVFVCVGLVLALLLGDVLWIQENIIQAEGSFSKAVALFPKFLSEFTGSFVIGCLLLAVGIASAIRTAGTGVRW